MLVFDKVTKYFVRNRKWRSKLRYYWDGSVIAQDAVCVLQDLSFEVQRGEVRGIVGPNAGGKTTLLKLVADLVRPDRGRVLIDARPACTQLQHIGMVTNATTTFYPRLTGYENLYFFGRLFGLSASDVRHRITAVSAVLRADDLLGRPFRQFSTGMSQKLGLCRALVHAPRILLLDEPTANLDAENRRLFHEYVRSARSAYDLTVVWVSHNLSEIDSQCSRVSYLHQSRFLWEGSSAEFKQKFFSRRYEVISDDDPGRLCRIVGDSISALSSELAAAGENSRVSVDEVFCPPLSEDPGPGIPPGGRFSPCSREQIRERGQRPSAPGRFRRLGRTCLLFFRQEFALQRASGQFFQQLAAMVLPLLSFYFIAQAVALKQGMIALTRPDYFSFAFVGMACFGFLSTAAAGLSASLRSAQLSGVLELVLASPVTLGEYLIAANAYSFIFSIVRLLIIIMIGMALGVDVAISPVRLSAACCLLFLCTTVSFGLGIITAAQTLLVRRANPIQFMAGSLQSLLSGVYFPQQVLPGWLRAAALLVPFAYAVTGIRDSLFGTVYTLSDFLSAAVPLVGFAVVLLSASVALFRWAVNKAKHAGTLSYI